MGYNIEKFKEELTELRRKKEQGSIYDYDLGRLVMAECIEKLIIPIVVQAKPEKVCELIRQKFDDWVFGLETQAGEKLKVVDSTDFNDIITEIESELKDLKQK